MIKVGQSIQRFIGRKLIHDKNGVTALEYGLIAALVAVAVILSLTTLGTNLKGVFTKLASSV